MNLKHLTAFVEVANTGHFGRAAENLKITQSGLSQIIKALEKSVGTKLIARTTRSVVLTDVGRSFYENAVELIQAHRLADQKINSVLLGDQGTVRLGFVASAALVIIPQLTVGINEQAPGISVTLEELTTTKQLTLIKEGHLDIGLLREVSQFPGLIISPLVKEALVLAVPGSHRLVGEKAVNMKELREESFITFPRSQVSYLYNKIVQLCKDAGFSPLIAQEAVQFATILGLVSSNVGIAIVPQSVAAIQLPNVSFVNIFGPESFSTIYMARRPDNKASPAQKRVTDIAEALFETENSAKMPLTLRGAG